MANKIQKTLTLEKKSIKILTEIKSQYQLETCRTIYESKIVDIALQELYRNLGFETEPTNAIKYLMKFMPIAAGDDDGE